MKSPISLIIAALYSFGNVYSLQCQSINWMKSIGGADYENLYFASKDKTGNLYICGGFKDTIDIAPGEEQTFLISSQSYDPFVLITDQSGHLLHAHSLEGTGWDQATIIKVDNKLNYYIGGIFGNEIDLDPGPDTLMFISEINNNIFFQKFDNQNNLKWAFQLVTYSENDKLYDMEIDNEENIYNVGSFTNTIDFDPGDNVFEMTASAERDVFIQKVDSAGQFIWAKRIGGWYESYAKTIAIDGLGNIVVAGSFKGEIDFDPGPDTLILSSEGVLDVFISNPPLCVDSSASRAVIIMCTWLLPVLL